MSVSARSYRPGDPSSVRQLPADAVAYRAAAPAAGVLYYEVRIAEVDVPAVEVGDIVEQRVTVRRNQAFHLTTWSFDGREPVRTSRLIVDVPKRWALRWGYWDGAKRAEFEPNRESLGQVERLTFEQHDLPSRQIEPQAPPSSGWTRRLDLAIADAPGQPGEDHFGTWSDIGAWYRKLTFERDRVSDEQWRAVQAALGASPTAEALFAYVRDRTRYVALYEDSLAAFRPHDASAVMQARFGDCKDMGTLLVALLRRAGVEAYPALVGVADRVFFDEGHPSISAFNHLVVVLPKPDGGYIYLDPTDKEALFGVLPWHLEGEGALVVRPQDVDQHRIPRAGASRHRAELRYEIRSMRQVDLTAQLEGIAARGWSWAAEHDAAQLPQRVSRAFFSQFGPRAVRVAEVQTVEDRVTVRASAEVPLLDRRTAVGRIVPLRGFVLPRLLKDPDLARSAAVYLERPGTWIVRVYVPGAAAELPTKTETTVAKIRHSFEAHSTDSGVEIVSELVIEDPRVPVERLPELRVVDAALLRAQQSALLLKEEQ